MRSITIAQLLDQPRPARVPGAGGELDIDPNLGIVAVTLGNVDPTHVQPVVDAALDALHVP